MEILSPPAVREIAIRQLDVGFPMGNIKSWTLYADDRFTKTRDTIEILFAAREAITLTKPGIEPVLTIPASPAEELTLYLRHVAWHLVRETVLRWPTKVPITGGADGKAQT